MIRKLEKGRLFRLQVGFRGFKLRVWRFRVCFAGLRPLAWGSRVLECSDLGFEGFGHPGIAAQTCSFCFELFGQGSGWVCVCEREYVCSLAFEVWDFQKTSDRQNTEYAKPLTWIVKAPKPMQSFSVKSFGVGACYACHAGKFETKALNPKSIIPKLRRNPIVSKHRDLKPAIPSQTPKP